MKGTILYGPGDVRFEDRPDPTIVEPTDAVIKLAASCICGSELWPYRGAEEQDGPVRLGRVVLARRVRGRGLADLLVRAALDRVGDREVVLDAQEPLAGWYAGFGWEVSGPGFLEDGIPHVPMRRPADGGPAVVPPDPADPAEL